MTRVALDSNILVYLAGVSRTPADDPKVGKVRELVARLSSLVSLVAPAQTLDELFVVLRRSGASAAEAMDILLEFSETFGTAATEARTMAAASDLTVDHKLQFWDALIVTAAADARCSVFLSEDMEDGFVTRGMTISNPLADQLHPRLATLLNERGEGSTDGKFAYRQICNLLSVHAGMHHQSL